MVDVPCLGHLWDGQKDCLDVGQVRCFHEEITGVWNLQGIYPLKDEWVFGCSLKTRLADQTKNSTTEVVMVKRHKRLNNQPEIG